MSEWIRIRSLLRGAWRRGEGQYGKVTIRPRVFRRRAIRSARSVRDEIGMPDVPLSAVLASLQLQDLYIVAALEGGCPKARVAMTRVFYEGVFPSLGLDPAGQQEMLDEWLGPYEEMPPPGR